MKNKNYIWFLGAVILSVIILCAITFLKNNNSTDKLLVKNVSISGIKSTKQKTVEQNKIIDVKFMPINRFAKDSENFVVDDPVVPLAGKDEPAETESIITMPSVENVQSSENIAVDSISNSITWEDVPYDSDLYWLAKLINGEAEGEPYNGKIAVGNVVINRVNSPDYFEDTIKGVIFEKDQFSVVGNRLNLVPTQESLNAAVDVLNGAWTEGMSSKVLYFNTSAGWWNGITLWKQIGHHYFGEQNY